MSEIQKNLNNRNSVMNTLNDIDPDTIINLILGLKKAKNIAEKYYIKYEDEKYNLLKTEESII